ncbi:hypothetical protein [uncultured Litoreibacter sp.]|uniref:hypothetical protein n=1 Tax=uncultured Litoreibacter sp. TaxID=1392394 RepID=UPI00260DBFCC|nr:hypothetical protein [uncultured Litoreibacter sp.]
MAYLSPPITCTCPTCGFKGRFVVVTGVGPQSRKGDIPYKSYKSPGPFTEHLDAQGKKTGSLLCPNDGTPVWTNQRAATAFGPITRDEHQRDMRRRTPTALGGPKNPFGVKAIGPMQPTWLKRKSRKPKRSS